MPVYIRRGFACLLLLALVACSSATLSGATPSTGYDQARSGDSGLDAVLDSAPQVTGGYEITRKLGIHPSAGSPAILINFVSNGPAQGGVPCISCVSGASSNDNIGLTGPSSYVPSGATWQYTLSFTDLTYKGKCTLAWAIMAGKKKIDSFSVSLKLASAGGFVLYGLNRTRPKFSGRATVTGKVTCGKDRPSLKVPIEFQ
ncbi:MAG: hypothetical protein JO104_12240 [Candidatus Eremiobacteraeota bacterium]|nr:hypothetical protein [Candidatus Eremiobacteraeota bacterium]